MGNRIKRWMLIILVGILVFHQISYPFISVASTEIETTADTLHNTEKEDNIEEVPDEKSSAQEKDEEETKQDVEEERTEEKQEERDATEERKTEETGEESVPGMEREEDMDRDEDTTREDEQMLDSSTEIRSYSHFQNTRLEAVPYANNSINMPKSTYQTLILQGAKGQGQRIAESGKVTMLPSNEEIQKDIDSKHKEYSSFTPHWSTSTSAILSTESGSKPVHFYLDDPKKAACASVFGDPVNEPYIVGGRVYRLTAAMKNQLSCTYTNVGRYYDRASGRSYGIDMKALLVDFTAKNKNTSNVQKAIDAGVLGEDGGALFAFVGRVGIGVLDGFCDSVTIKYSYYIHGTNTPISVKGFAQFADVDAQQGIEFSAQADYFYAVNGANQYLGCSKGVNKAGNKAYIYSLSSREYHNSNEHTFFTLFSGSEMTLTFTFMKCSRTDDGGSKNGSDLEKYQVPFDPSTVRSYSGSESGGYMSFTARQASLSQPEIGKTVFNGEDVTAEVLTPHQDTYNTLSAVSDSFTYKVRTVCPYEDASEHHYGSWIIEDKISPYLNVKKVSVYDGTGGQSNAFDIQTKHQNDGSTLVTATAKNVTDQNFYEKNWYDLYITVQVKSQEELEQYNLNLSDIFAKTGARQGSYVLKNHATLNTGSILTSNQTETVIPQWIQVKKVNEQGNPVQGITFGIFIEPDASPSETKPLMTAETGKDGIAHFRRTTFYDLAGKVGPYYVKEVSRNHLENVYYLEDGWSYAFSADQGNGVVFGETGRNEGTILKDRSKILKEYTVFVRKKNKETSDTLQGAEFSLYQWSVEADSYMKLTELVEKKDDSGYYYTNDRSFSATEDNLGRFMVKETKAPYGCYNSGQEWIFETTDLYVEDHLSLEFYYQTKEGSVVTQKQELIYQNNLQKGKLNIHKTDDENNSVEGAVFGIRAAEDIYAPWQYDEAGNPRRGEEPLVAKNALCDTIITDQNGCGTSRLLYIGKYIVTEMEGAVEHIKSDQIHEVIFEYPEKDETKAVTKNLEVGNNIMRPSMAIAKLAERTRNEEGQAVAFEKETGRFTETKVPGVYHAGEWIRYEITVTNTGNVDLHHLHLTDTMTEPNEAGQTLEDYVEKENASFVIPDDQKYVSSLGYPVSCSLVGDDGTCMILEKLMSGDSVTVYFEVPIASESANVYRLRNKVSVTASYDNNQDSSGLKLIPVNTGNLVDEQGNLLTEDEDCVHIPGTPEQTVVKIADRTTGCTISHGILSGTKVPGVYEAGEEVLFSIVVRNAGTSNLKKILVTDILSEELKNVIEEDSATFLMDSEEGKLMTENGESIDARLIDATKLLLCGNSDPVTGEGTLRPGDVVTLSFRVTLKKEISNLYDLENKVIVHSFYYTGEKEEELVPVEDTDQIEVPGNPEARLAKIADHTTGTVLVDGRYEKEKITGSYKNGEQVVYTITITNTGSADLYDLKIRDVMEERLVSALEKDSAGFQYGTYYSEKGDKIESQKSNSGEKENQCCIILDHLKAGDSVDLLLKGKVNEKAGDLSKLENKAYVTAHYRKGNEEAQKNYEDTATKSGITYVLQYHANNGTTEKTLDSETPAVAKKKVTINGNPFHKEGYTFLGWNTSADGNGESFGPGAVITMSAQDMNLYAQWGKPGTILKKQYEYALTYHSNNKKKQEQPDSETRCLAGTILTLDSNMFSYEGYRFLGWSETPEGTVLLQPETSFQMPKKDVHLYACWEKIDNVTLIYHSNFINTAFGEEKEVTKMDFETPCQPGTEVTIKQNEFEREDYTFEGWSKNPKAEHGDMKPEETLSLKEDTQLYAIWKPRQPGEEQFSYPLVYHGNNETMDSYVDSETPCMSSKEILLDTNRFAYRGYEFTGWNTKADGTGKTWESNTLYTMPEKKVHLYAQWKRQETFILSYQSNYPEGTGKTNQEEKTDCQTPCSSGTEITLDGNQFRCDGYAFLGWSIHPDNQNQTADLLLPGEKYSLTENTVLYAIWTTQLKEYTLLYSSNEQTPIWETAPYSPCPAGTPHKLIENPFGNKTRTFVGWSRNPDAKEGSEDILSPGTRLEQPERNIILYAIWREEENVSLYYDANGGTISERFKEALQNQTIQEGTSSCRILDGETPCLKSNQILLDINPFEKEGYRFLGWSTEPSNQKETRLLYPGNELMIPDKNIILYAIWEKMPQMIFEENDLAESRYTPIAVTNLMQDNDHINIPGAPDLRIAKSADRTKGIKLKEGRYEGKRIPGTYYQDETITYKIIVSNCGTSAALDVKIEEKPSSAWKKALKLSGFTVSAGETIKTSQGKTAVVLKKTKNKVVLDKLDPGDRIILYYEAIVNTKQIQKKTLKNTVQVTGQQKDGTPIPKTSQMTDSDRIKIEDKESTHNIINGNTPKTGDHIPTIPWIILGIGAFFSAIIIFVINKKEKIIKRFR